MLELLSTYAIDAITFIIYSVAIFANVAWIQIYPMWFLIYKPKKVCSNIDELLENHEITFRFNPSNLKDLSAKRIQHILFSIWVIFLLGFQFYFCDSFQDFIKLNVLLIPVVGFLAYLIIIFTISTTIKIISEFPKHKKIASQYLNQEWKAGIFFFAICLTLIETFKNLITYIFTSNFVKSAKNLIKLSILSSILLFAFLLVVTTLRIDRESFVEICNKISPSVATATKNFYNNFDKKFNSVP